MHCVHCGLICSWLKPGNCKSSIKPPGDLKTIPIKCFVSHRPVSCAGGSVGRGKKEYTHVFQFTFAY